MLVFVFRWRAREIGVSDSKPLNTVLITLYV